MKSKKPPKDRAQPPPEFDEVLRIIRSGRAKAFEAVNVALIETYLAVGAFLSRQVAAADWGKGVVARLSAWLLAADPDLKGFSASNLWRMKQFFEIWQGQPKLATLLRELSWSKHLLLMAQCKTNEAREFYLIASTRARWSHRELQRQISSAAFERTMLADAKLATLPRVLPAQATGVFKDSYLLDFLNLPDNHKEADLQCLVAFELKTGRFEPEHVGKLAFYLEALDRDRKRTHENPSIGVLLCRSKDDEVVEYALNRHLSPAMVAEYETRMIPKAVLQQKLHEWSLMLQAPDADQMGEV